MDRRVGETSRKCKNGDDDGGQQDNQKELPKHETAEAAIALTTPSTVVTPMENIEEVVEVDYKSGELGPKRKHEGENNEQPNEKKKKVATLETPEVAASTMKITDDDFFIDDCLEPIVKYLAFQDLINLGDTCKRFQSFIKLTFASKYKEKEICLWPEPHPSGKSIYIDGSGISFIGISKCLKVLRYFGATITKLEVSFDPSLNKDQKIALAEHINEHCADTLTDITINYFTEDLMTNWKKPFSKAESITLCYSKFGVFTTWFPKMRRLINRYSDADSIKYTFPHLEELVLESRVNCENKKENVLEVLRLNPNLQTLRIDCACPFDIGFFRKVSDYLQSVSILHIPFCYRFEHPSGRPIHLQNVKEFSITLWCLPSAPKIPFSFDRLEKATLNIPRHFVSDLDECFVDFVKQNPSLTKLTIRINKFIFDDFTLNLRKVLPSLEVGIKFQSHDLVHHHCN